MAQRLVITLTPRRAPSWIFWGSIALTLGFVLLLAVTKFSGGPGWFDRPTGAEALIALVLILLRTPLVFGGSVLLGTALIDRFFHVLDAPPPPPAPVDLPIVFAKRQEAVRCPYCHDALDAPDTSAEPLIECVGCRAYQHLECLREARGRCSSCRAHLPLVNA